MYQAMQAFPYTETVKRVKIFVTEIEDVALWEHLLWWENIENNLEQELMKNNLIKSLILSGCLAMTIVSCERKELSAGGLLLSDGWKVQSSAKIFLPGEEVSNSQIKKKSGMMQ